MSKRWRVYCTEGGDEGWKYIWSDTTPTGCPNDNGHTYNVESIKQFAKEVPLLRCIPRIQKIRANNLMEVGLCHFNPDDYPGLLRRAKILAYLDNGETSYDFEVYDRDNNVSLVTTTFSNMNNRIERNSTDTILTPPTTETILSFNLKKDGTNNKKYVWIEEITLWFEVLY
jgi:hypothetical protein